MYEYDDSEDYSSANSFRARSNTWPLNRPDLIVPNGVCIDETLPEIELEEDDLFTTNENWSMGLDHDIMSWDPILNAQQNSQQQQQHHHPQQANQQQQTSLATNSQHPQPQQIPQQQQQQQHNQHQTTTVHHHQSQQQHHHHHHHQQQPQPPRQHIQQSQTLHHQHIHSSQHQHNESIPCCPTMMHRDQVQSQQLPQQQQQHQQHNDSILCGSAIMNRSQLQQQQPDQQILQQQQPQLHQTHQHQTLNNTQCLESDEPNEFHIRQMHNLRLDNYPPSSNDHQSHYVPMNRNSTLCNQQQQHGGNPNLATLNNTENFNISPDHHLHPHQHHHHNLQPLNSVRYDPDHQNDHIDSFKLHNDNDNLHQHQSHHHNHHQLHHMTSSSLTDHHTHALSSSLSTSGIGLSGDLEDLDYKGLDSSNILLSNSVQYDDQEHQDQLQPQLLQTGSEESGPVVSKNSPASSKTKLNTPRRNAWGNMSYADLISQAIESTNDKRLTLSQIYDWMVQNVPYFKDKGDSNSSAGWKNSVRHNLSLHNRFRRLQNEGTGKSSWWTINPEANVGKCARRRAASMEASKYEKKRGRAKKRADAIRQGLLSYPSLDSSLLNGSTGNLDIGQQQQPTQQQQPQQLQLQSEPSPQEQLQQQQHLNSTNQQFGCQEQQQQQQQTDGLFNLIICD